MLFRDSWVEVNLDALKQNIEVIQKINQKKMIAVIKANGYGCGDRDVALAALEAGASMLAVSSLDEALSLRNQGINAEILVLSYVNPHAISMVIKKNITLTAVSMDWVKALIEQNCAGCKVHLKADTGMNRIGFKDPQQMKQAAELLMEKGVIIDGLFSHLACAEDDGTVNRLQMKKFREFIDCLDMNLNWVHLRNSDGIMNFNEDDCCNASRCGLAMMGISGFNSELQPVMALKSRVICVKKIEAGEYVGYGWTYQSNTPEWIATIPIGYADGWSRKNQGRSAWLNGEKCEFVGRICMDQAMLRVPEGTKVNDVVELFGPCMPAEQVAKELDTIPYEIMTSLTDRLARIYLKSGKTMKIANPRFRFEE